MPLATPQGTLDFKSVDTITFVGASSNTVIDTTTGSFGVGVDGNGPTSNLHVVGDALITGNVADLNIVSNVNMLHTSNTASIKLNSNVVTEFSRSKKLIKYPRVALTGASQDGYVASASSNHTEPTYGVYKAFNGVPNDFFHWETASFANSDGSYSAATQSFESTSGEWLKIQLPNKIKPTSTKLYRRGFDGQSPKDFKIYASITGSSWTLLTEQTGVDDWTNAAKSYSFTANIYYKYFAILVTKITRTNSAGAQTSGTIGEWELYGTPENDPEAHGVDVVVKSVPNVPNTDWLDVYYDAKDLADGAVSTTSGAITGLGGTTNNGTAFGDPQVSNGAFVFDGTGDYIDASVSSTFTGNQMYTFSSWIKPNSHPSGYIGVFGIGTNSTNDSIGLFLDSGTIIHLTYGNNLVTTTYVTIGEWVHITGTYDGTGRTIFVNGKLVGTDSYSSLTLAGTTFRLGSNLVGGQNFNGSIANFRLFNRALTTDEIYQLYAYQKEYFGHGTLGMTLKAGRLGIGTSEPRAALDVRGGIHANGSQSWPIPTAHFYKASPGTASQAYTENFDTGRVDLDNTLRDAPGIIERVVLTSSSPVVTTNGTTGGVIKFCKPGNYHVSGGVGVAKQSSHTSGFDLQFRQVGTEGSLAIGKTIHSASYGGEVLEASKTYAMGYRRTFLVHVSEAPTYGSLHLQPSANNGSLFRFETYGDTSLAHADVYYLG